MTEWIRGSVLLIVLVIAIITDVRTMKIPNWLTFPFIGVSIVYEIVTKDQQWVANIVVVVFLFLMSLLDAVGIGDAKLLIGVTLLCGWNVSLTGLILGSVLFVIFFFIRKPRKVLSQIKAVLKALFSGDLTFLKELDIKERKPFAPALAMGIALAYLGIVAFPIWR